MYKSKWEKKVLLVIFIIYIGIVLWLTIIRPGVHYNERQLNLTLFTELIKIYHRAGMLQFLRLFLGNIGWFIPFGFLLPALSKRENFIRVIISGFLFSLTIETTQFIFYKGVAEIDDLILNTLGTIIGYFIKIFRILCKKL